jgi:hypothetical protein
MSLKRNPFFEVYFTESIAPEEYTQLFSPFLINDALAVFQPGNIFLEGVQGSGKSMLLALLKPEIRIAYQNANEKFPIPDEFSRFIGAGINLVRCGVLDFGGQIRQGADDSECNLLVALFGDFVNYWIINDIFDSLMTCYSNINLRSELEINADDNALNAFVTDLREQRCWFGAFDDAHDFKSFKETILGRINDYRRFMDGYSTISQSIVKTITSPEEPISQVVRSLRAHKIIPIDLNVYIRIDQCEEMVRLEAKAAEKLLHIHFREFVNKMIGMRDPEVSYRLGGRRYAFRSSAEMRMYGTTASLEDMRNYKRIDMDEILRRRENRMGWPYQKFAQDVFRRRLQWCGYSLSGYSDDLISYVLGGPHMSVAEKVEHYTRNSKRGIIDCQEEWPSEVCHILSKLEGEDVLSAKLGEAWVRQQFNRSKKGTTPDYPQINYSPWEKVEKKWWKKERLFLASLQIAAKRGQKLIWARRDDVINLSGNNILIFLTIFQHIWQIWLRIPQHDVDWNDDTSLPRIKDPYIQSEGIGEASDRWYDKIKEEPRGDSRRRFVSMLGMHFRNSIREDKNMSYPGNNGISLSLGDLESDEEVYSVLQDASAYGAMVDMKHTPKTKTRGESRKWYLHPVLAPHFQIPAMHTKEPMYVDTKRVRKWLEKSRVVFPNSKSQPIEVDK